ncbi:MAG: hypothetical protein ABEJ31_01710 [Haloarculaceae archaeon]
MNQRRLAPTLGVVACLGEVLALGVPYVLADSGRSVGVYYAAGPLNPLVAGLFALIALIVFAAGREGRTDPGLAAGVTIVLGLFATAIALAWATTVPVDVAWTATGQVETVASSHRWVVVGFAALWAVAGGWYARALGVV